MKIEVVAAAQYANAMLCNGKTVVVIDVLRATSVIVTALSNDAQKVIPVATIEGAFSEAQKHPESSVILGGERQGKIISGFHIGNSPLDYTKERIENKTIILSTTNGTLAISNCKEAEKLFIVSFLNVDFAAKKLADLQQDLLIVCSGTNGKFSMDDALCAGMLMDKMNQLIDIDCCDLGQTLLQMHRNENLSISEKLANCTHVKYLESLGYKDDIAYCLQVGGLVVLPEYHKDGFLFLEEN